MKNLKKKIRDNFLFYNLYDFLGFILVSLLSVLIKERKKQILFISYGGDKIDDSPYYIYKEIIQDDYFDDYKLIWAVSDSSSAYDKIHNVRTQIINANSPTYFYYLYKSKIWVTNTSVYRGIRGKTPKNITYINTWHGTPFKLIGEDVNSKSDLKKKHQDKNTIYLTQSKYEAEIFETAFDSTIKYSVMSGLPRNDVLYNYQDDPILVSKIKQSLNINTERKILIYAPTYRESHKLKDKKETEKLILELEKKFFILYRGHHADLNDSQINNLNLVNFKNVSDYNDLNNLLLISDLLLTDYSSICIDFAILKKPIYFWVYDYNDYNKERGLYFDLFEVFSSGISESRVDIINAIFKDSTHESGIENMTKIREMFLEELGNGTANAIKLIKKLEKK